MAICTGLLSQMGFNKEIQCEASLSNTVRKAGKFLFRLKSLERIRFPMINSFFNAFSLAVNLPLGVAINR